MLVLLRNTPNSNELKHDSSHTTCAPVWQKIYSFSIRLSRLVIIRPEKNNINANVGYENFIEASGPAGVLMVKESMAIMMLIMN